MHDKHGGEEMEGGHDGCMCGHGMGAGFREFKLAKLEKKSKILEAELEFINKLKELVKKMPESKDK
jgi:hypothetical protein